MSMKFAITIAATLAAVAGPALAGEYGRATAKTNGNARNVTKSIGAFASSVGSDVRADGDRSYDFQGWPTDYLVNRFGDHQAQGRF